MIKFQITKNREYGRAATVNDILALFCAKHSCTVRRLADISDFADFAMLSNLFTKLNGLLAKSLSGFGVGFRWMDIFHVKPAAQIAAIARYFTQGYYQGRPSSGALPEAHVLRTLTPDVQFPSPPVGILPATQSPSAFWMLFKSTSAGSSHFNSAIFPSFLHMESTAK
jgi:hypothetical protein